MIQYHAAAAITGPRFDIDTDSINRRFYGSCKTILNHSVNQSELLRLSLMVSYLIPVLQYCIGAIKLNES